MRFDEAATDVEVISTHREYPDAPVDVVVRVADKYYKYLNVGSDDVDTLRWMIKKGAGYRALNAFKKKKYDYEKVER